MAKLLGIEFAPLRIPLRRRLQTLAVWQFLITIFIIPIVSIVLTIYFLLSRFFLVPLIYIGWWWFFDRQTPKQGGRRVEWIRRSKIWTHMRDYFPISLIKTGDLDPSENYIIGYHPHGIIGCGAFCNFTTEATGFSSLYPNIRCYLLTLDSNFYWPLLRSYIMAMGMCNVSRDSMMWLLTKNGPGTACVVVIGGAEEALEAFPGSYKLALNRRKGFVRVALKTGANLVPCYSFGENDLYKQAKNPEGSWVRCFQERFKILFGCSPPFFYGRGIFNYTWGFMPYRHSVNTVVGSPIKVVQNSEPSAEEIDKLHKTYLNALSELFDEHKGNYGIPEDKTLSFY